ncbi:ankyrin repeat and MYND domain-containing protein 2 [Diorhabda carinulata]|uniref:ankyrin repeat and MYND domain-containing protein 2 n=1 Tax=Diorhabda carinulata TaxID=1163345 RepID=UPI0025A07B3F|nr:ankyrin repeat and MYND domain-containing protein 2 [Diorhabda carinulata]
MSEKNKTVLTETEEQIFKAIENNDVVLLKTLLSQVKNVNIVDENSMTPLQHAAYKGNKDLVQVLLDQGADVNYCEHQHTYTALHFAGLSGNSDVCLALLLAGAKSHITNTVGRTPSQMAAFVGHHNCVAVINSYIPKSDVDYYTTEPPNKAPYLPPFLAESFHRFVMQTNINPIKVVLNVQNFVGISEHLSEVKKVLELMCEREIKRGADRNEVMSFKFHYLGYIVGEILKVRQRQSAKKDESEEEKKLDITELFTRKLLKPGKDGHLEFMDSFLKECIREFPYRDCTLFRQMVASLASKDPPTALSVISHAINGQRGFEDSLSVCNTCGEEKPAKKCSKCKVVQYCDRSCQRLHWHWHKKACPRLSQMIDTDPLTKPDAAELSTDLQNLLVNN